MMIKLFLKIAIFYKTLEIFFSLNEATRKQILERYVARYINHVTTQKEASNGGNGCSNSLVVGTSGSAAALHSSGRIIDYSSQNGKYLYI